MKPSFLLFAALLGLSAPAAADSTYDLLIVACDNRACDLTAGQTVSNGLANATEYSRDGLKLMIETLARRTNEEDARVSLNVRPADDGAGTWRATAASLSQRLEVIQCTLKHGPFGLLTSFVSEGKTYQIWARLAAR